MANNPQQGSRMQGPGLYDVKPPPGGFQARPTVPITGTGPVPKSQQTQQIYNRDGTPSYTYNAGDPVRPPPPPSGSATAGPKGGGTTPAPPAAPPDSRSEFQQAVDAIGGRGNPFGPQQWYGGNPLETAQAMATRQRDQGLAELRARYGANGLGNSSRLALAEGQAMADSATGLGDVLAARGQAARSDDLGRLANMFLGAGQQDLAAKQLALNANQQQANMGTGMTGIGAGEQGIPNAQELLNFLINFSQQVGSGRGAAKSG